MKRRQLRKVTEKILAQVEISFKEKTLKIV